MNKEGSRTAALELPEALHLIEKLEAENRRFRNLLRQAPGYVAVFNGQGHHYAFANEAYYDLVGHRKILGKSAAEALPADTQQPLIAILDQVFLTGETVLRGAAPTQLTDRSGSITERYLHFLYQPVKDDRGEVSGVICIGHDVTDEVNNRAEAVRLRDELVHVSRVSAMGTMASSLAHELNQPLAAAGSYLAGVERLLRHSSAGDNVLYGVTKAQQQVQRAGDIIRRIRELLAGKRREMRMVSVSEAINEVVTLLRSTGEWGNVEIERHIDPDAEMVTADQIQLEQVFLNIIRNALQAASAHKTPNVQINATRRAEEISIAVRDNGTGLGDRDPDSIFTGFVSDKPGGLGIGLSISRTIIEAHEGSITAKSERGGTCITVSLPAPDPQTSGSG